MAVGLSCLWLLLAPDRGANERAAAAGTCTILAALRHIEQRHGSAALDAWTGTVAALGDTVPPELAAADPTRPDPKPYRGYWFVLIEDEETGTGWTTGGKYPPSQTKPAVCAYPARYGSTGLSTFLATFSMGTLKADTKGVPPACVPSMREAQQRWAKYQ